MVSVVSLARSTCRMMDTIVRYRKILAAVTNIEIAKRYSGFAFGKIWVVLYPALLLGNYLFVYLVIFRMRFPDYSQFDYVLYVFCGLIPFLAISETLATGCLVLKQNLHLVKNVMLPIELIPVRSVLVSMVAQLASMGILLIMLGFHGNLTFHVLWLPFILVLQFFMLLGMLLILSLLALLIPDVSYFVNLLLLFLMFVSPIGFKPEMVPEKLRFRRLSEPHSLPYRHVPLLFALGQGTAHRGNWFMRSCLRRHFCRGQHVLSKVERRSR